MGENSKIEWCDHTFNPWMGCTKVSPACDGCYAEAMMDLRYGKVKWGGDRVRTAPSNWKQPIKWNKDAGITGARPRVFCASLADVFDNQVPPEWREDLFELIRITPNLVWLLLTKRPQNIVKMVHASGAIAGNGTRYLPRNAALGTTIEDQTRADINVPALLDAKVQCGPAFVFVSAEPLLGPIDIGPWISTCYECGSSCGLRLSGRPAVERCEDCGEECGPETEPVISEGCPKCSGELEAVCPDCGHFMVYQHPDTPVLDWVIAGGETDQGQHKARPSHPEWFRSLRDQCAASGTAFHFKQWGEWAPHRAIAGGDLGGDVRAGRVRIVHPTGQSDVEVSIATGGRNTIPGSRYMARVGKKRAGRILGGIEHNGFPAVSA